MPLHLGTPVAAWTTHVSATDPRGISGKQHGFFISIFPERDNSVHFEVLSEDDAKGQYRTPLGYDGETLPQLINLKSFVTGGNEIDDCKVLVCIKSIGVGKRGKLGHDL